MSECRVHLKDFVASCVSLMKDILNYLLQVSPFRLELMSSFFWCSTIAAEVEHYGCREA